MSNLIQPTVKMMIDGLTPVTIKVTVLLCCQHKLLSLWGGGGGVATQDAIPKISIAAGWTKATPVAAR